MEIKGIGNQNYVPLTEVKKTNVQPQETEKKQDKLEISNEAKALQVKNEKVKDLSKIQQNIQDNVYNSDKVIAATAEAILKQLKLS